MLIATGTAGWHRACTSHRPSYRVRRLGR